MCLICPDSIRREAFEDIMCFKVLKLSSIGYMTPCVEALIYDEDNVLHHKKPFVASDEVEIVHMQNGLEINNGYIHVFRKLEDAAVYSKYLESIDETDSPMRVFRCIIPKGTVYFQGYYDHYGPRDSFAAKQIVFIEQMQLNFLNCDEFGYNLSMPMRDFYYY